MHGIRFMSICPGFTDTHLLNSMDDKLHCPEASLKTTEIMEKMGLQS